MGVTDKQITQIFFKEDIFLLTCLTRCITYITGSEGTRGQVHRIYTYSVIQVMS